MASGRSSRMIAAASARRAHRKRRPVEQDRQQHHRQHDEGARRRGRRAADDEIEARARQRRAGRPFLDRISAAPARESPPARRAPARTGPGPPAPCAARRSPAHGQARHRAAPLSSSASMPPRSPVMMALAMAPSLPGKRARMRAVMRQRRFSIAAASASHRSGWLAPAAPGSGAP